uniref:Oxidation resistance protein 1 n=1 Tax=Mesocestoides corti TaxID=53468 RepID=A0A5K3EFK9_MESCO
MVTRQTIMFLPADGEWQNFLPIEMRYEHIRSIAAYNDASVFVFTKRPRFSKQCSSFTGSSSDEASRSNLSTTEQAVGEGGETLEPLLQENEIFLCCSVQRNSLAPGSPVGSTICSSGAQWLIISRQRIQDLNDFLVSCNLGFATVISMEDESDNDGEGLRKKDAVEALGALIPRRMTQHFRHQDPTKARQRSYIGRSLGRLIQRTSSTKHKTAGSGTISSRRRPLSVGCSEELFSDHAAVEMVSPSNNTGDETESAVFGQSSSSTPSFADEKEVFDMLRQTSLEWELVSKQELSQRNAGGETESEADRSETTNSTQFPHLSPPNSLAQSRILSSQAQIQDLFEAIPMRVQSFDWFLTFSTEEHGFSLKTLYRRCDNFKCSDLLTSFDTDAAQTAGDFEERTAVSKMRSLSFNQENQPCVLLIRDTTDCIMGAYLSSHPHLSQGAFYGTGETFVFHWTMPDVSPCEEEILTEENAGAASKIDIPNFKKYSWSQKNSFFISSEPEALIIGCSNASPALWIDGDLHRGRSQACETFDSPQLIPGGDFCIHTVELWSLS